VIETRLYEWTVQRKGSGTGTGAGSIAGSCSKEDGEADPSWTRVNKCTQSFLFNKTDASIQPYRDDAGNNHGVSYRMP